MTEGDDEKTGVRNFVHATMRERNGKTTNSMRLTGKVKISFARPSDVTLIPKHSEQSAVHHGNDIRLTLSFGEDRWIRKILPNERQLGQR